MMRQMQSRYVTKIVAVALTVLPSLAVAESSVESFTAKVNTGAIKQTSSGSGNQQDVNVGSVAATKAGKFSATVTTGSITQSSRGNGIVQKANIGSATNSTVNSFSATVKTGDIEQVSTRSGERQELDIGSVNNSRVNGTFNSHVKVKDGVRQTGSGEVVLGSVKNSDIQNFDSNLEIQGKVSGNNIRIGSVIGQEQYDQRGRSQGVEPDSSSVPKVLTPSRTGKERLLHAAPHAIKAAKWVFTPLDTFLGELSDTVVEAAGVENEIPEGHPLKTINEVIDFVPGLGALGGLGGIVGADDAQYLVPGKH